MIVDTTYLLPLARIEVETDLLAAIVDGRVDLRLSELGVSEISLFELQAKAAKLGVPADVVSGAIDFIVRNLRVVPFYQRDVISVSFELRRRLRDYIDCVIVATAVVSGEDLVTEDSRIHALRSFIESEYGIRVLRYSDLVR